MKLFIAISAFTILVSSDDQINANKIGHNFIENVESILKTNDVAKVNEIYADDYVLESCGKTYNKTLVVEALLKSPPDGQDVDFKVVNGKYDGVELSFTLITDIKNISSFEMVYIVQKYDTDKPIITYNNFTDC